MEIRTIHDKIVEIRGQKVMIDRDLAEMYGVQTRVLNQAVKRNKDRFPEDFMFQLTEKEMIIWLSQTVITKSKTMGRHTNNYQTNIYATFITKSLLLP